MVYRITVAGRRAVLGSASGSGVVAGPRIALPTAPYAGAELRSRVDRPGAYDALAKPSRIGQALIWPRQALPA
jgi:hypothetical protein